MSLLLRKILRPRSMTGFSAPCRSFADFSSIIGGKERTEENQYIRHEEKERLRKRRIDIEADIRRIITMNGDKVSEDTINSLATAALEEEIRNA